MDVDVREHGQEAAELLLPPGACLLHIGPYKTGSTSLQTALHRRRSELAAHGVVYPGTTVRPVAAGYAVLGYRPRGGRPLRPEAWDHLVEEVRAADQARVCVSTEDFGSASTEVAGRIVDGLGAERVHVVAVVRRLDRLLTSQWQERVKDHEVRRLDDWLRLVLGDDQEHREWQRFWASHDLVRMFERWEPWVGRDRFTLVVADEHDPASASGVFEQMLGLPAGFLRPEAPSNSSLSANATALLRRLNEAFEASGWPDETYRALVQRGAVQDLREAPRPASEERIPGLPRWAAARAAELHEQRLEAFAERGVRLVGDPALLAVDPASSRVGDVPEPDRIALETAVLALSGLVRGAAAELDRLQAAQRPAPQGPGIDAVPTAAAAREIARRAVRRLRRGVARP